MYSKLKGVQIYYGEGGRGRWTDMIHMVNVFQAPCPAPSRNMTVPQICVITRTIT